MIIVRVLTLAAIELLYRCIRWILPASARESGGREIDSERVRAREREGGREGGRLGEGGREKNKHIITNGASCPYNFMLSGWSQSIGLPPCERGRSVGLVG